MRIGFFDSGVGGITVLKEAIRLLPNENFLYYADTMNVPYGSKNAEQVQEFIFDAVEFIAHQGIKALVIACNTATSLAINELRKNYSFPIIGMEPAVKPAIEAKNDRKRVLVLATQLTLSLQKYNDLVSKIDKFNEIDNLPLPGLVQFAEDFVFDRDIIKKYMRHQLVNYDIDQYGAVVLGCTHFQYYKSCFSEVFRPGTHIIDGSIGTVKHLKNIIEIRNDKNESGHGDIVFFADKKEESIDSRYHKYLNLLEATLTSCM